MVRVESFDVQKRIDEPFYPSFTTNRETPVGIVTGLCVRETQLPVRGRSTAWRTAGLVESRPWTATPPGQLFLGTCFAKNLMLQFTMASLMQTSLSLK